MPAKAYNIVGLRHLKYQQLERSQIVNSRVPKEAGLSTVQRSDVIG